MFRLGLLIISGSALVAAGCVHDEDGGQRGEITVAADVLVTDDGSGGYQFSYSAPFFDEKGNFDFSAKGAAYNDVKLSFTIADGSAAGLKFKSTGPDAIWIVDKRNVGRDGSPTGPYEGRQFHSFAVSADGLTLTLIDENDDAVLYRYGLRFDLGGETVVDDPDGQNGGSGGHG